MTKASGIDIEPPCGNSAGEESMIEYRAKQEGDFSYALPASESDSPESPPRRPSPAAGQAHHERAAAGQARSPHLRSSWGNQQHQDCATPAGGLRNGAALARSLARSGVALTGHRSGRQAKTAESSDRSALDR